MNHQSNEAEIQNNLTMNFTGFTSWSKTEENENMQVESYQLSNGKIIRFVVEDGTAVAIDASALGDSNGFDADATYQKMQALVTEGKVLKL